MKRIRITLAVMLALTLAACAPEDEGLSDQEVLIGTFVAFYRFVDRCELTGNSLCINEFGGSATTYCSVLAGGQSWGGFCATEDSFGSCIYAGSTREVVYYPPYDLNTARGDCDATGGVYSETYVPRAFFPL